MAWGRTIPNGDPAEPFAENTKFNGVIILPSINLPKDFYKLKINDSKIIEFFSVVPLYEEEMNLKLAEGSDALLEQFDKCGVSDIIDIDRKSVV